MDKAKATLAKVCSTSERIYRTSVYFYEILKILTNDPLYQEGLKKISNDNQDIQLMLKATKTSLAASNTFIHELDKVLGYICPKSDFKKIRDTAARQVKNVDGDAKAKMKEICKISAQMLKLGEEFSRIVNIFLSIGAGPLALVIGKDRANSLRKMAQTAVNATDSAGELQKEICSKI